MCLNYFWFFSVVSILISEIHGEKWNGTFELGGKKILVNILPSIDTLSEESKRVIYRDIKNNIEQRPRILLNEIRRVKLLRIPPTFLQPPKVQRHDVYSSQKKIMIAKLQRDRTTTSRPDEVEGDTDSAGFYVRDHAPDDKDEESDESTDDPKNQENSKETEESEEKDRINFHIHGHEGPDTYAFGYDTGNGNNRQFRYEEKHENGTVTGNYGYYDARGKLRKVHYSSHPSPGYAPISG